MALSADTLKFLLQQLRKGTIEGFTSIPKQIFHYLKEEIKDNPIYLKYETETPKWITWLNKEALIKLILPETLEESKVLAFAAYKAIASMDSNKAQSFIISLFNESRITDNYNEFNKNFFDYFTQALNDILLANPEIQTDIPQKTNGTNVFIIHGHDDHLKVEVQLLMMRAGVRSLVLHEAPDKGRHTLDKLLEETKDAGYAIALLTPDDLAENGTNRARQNVILEIGYFLGQLGKARVRMLIKEGVEIPSDLHGVLYQKYDMNGAWKSKLMKEMQAVGIFVDMQAVIESL